FSSRRRHTRSYGDWSSDVCSSDLFTFGIVFAMAMFATASACQKQPDVPAPAVTAKGSAGEEDVPDLTIRQVNLKAGETLLVSCRSEERRVGKECRVRWWADG